MATSGANLRYFAAGYLARPLGGIIMAHFGDLVGRKNVHSEHFTDGDTDAGDRSAADVFLDGDPAPLLLLLMRILQGAAIGGEVPGPGCLLPNTCRSAVSALPVER